MKRLVGGNNNVKEKLLGTSGRKEFSLLFQGEGASRKRKDIGQLSLPGT